MIKYKKGFKYQLAKFYRHQVRIYAYDIETEYISLKKTGMLIIKKGYAWDGPSGLTIDTKSSMRGSLVHDALYELLRKSYLPVGFGYRTVADMLLWEICVEDGMWKWRADIWLAAVQNFAGFAASKDSLKPILEAGK
jgi:hypothetical protein